MALVGPVGGLAALETIQAVRLLCRERRQQEGGLEGEESSRVGQGSASAGLRSPRRSPPASPRAARRSTTSATPTASRAPSRTSSSFTCAWASRACDAGATCARPVSRARARGGALSPSPPPGRGGRTRAAPPRRARAPRTARSARRALVASPDRITLLARWACQQSRTPEVRHRPLRIRLECVAS
jgi:hypothetical protein